VDELLDQLAAHRRRIRRARAADAALRWAFYASVAACLAVLVTKFAGIALPVAVAAAGIAAIPAAVAVREWARAFSIRDCAIHLDRLLGLDERLSSALEAAGGMGAVLRADATVALRRAPMPRRAYPRESKLLLGSLALLAALLVIPAPDRSGARGDPAFEAVTLEQIKSLEALAGVDVRFQEAADALRDGRPEEAIAKLEELKAWLAAKFLQSEGNGTDAATQKLLDQATSSASAIAAQMARLGRTVHAPPPAVARAKLERQRTLAQSADPAPTAASPSAAPGPATPLTHSWSPRYDPVIRRYFGREP
jgi:hypothetical protein